MLNVLRGHPVFRPIARRLFVLSIFVACCFVLPQVIRTIQKRGKPPQPVDSRALSATTMLLCQQLDTVFTEITAIARKTTSPLTPETTKLLLANMRFDEQFLVATRGMESYKFERAITHGRLGQTARLMGNLEISAGEYEAAARLFKTLVNDSPPMNDHYRELIFAYVDVAGCHMANQRPDQAVEAMRLALSVMRSPQLQLDSELEKMQSSLLQKLL